MSEQMKNKRDLSDTMDVNVELARRAVGSLFFNDDEEEVQEDTLQEDAAHQRERWSEIKRHRAEKHKLEDEEPAFANTTPLPTPKPAVKVNPSIPAVSRIPIRSEKRSAEDSDMPKEALILENNNPQNNVAADETGSDEGEFADFRQRLELARKAVDSLFLSEDVSGAGTEKRLTEKHSPQEHKPNEHKNEVLKDKVLKEEVLKEEVPKEEKTENSEAITESVAPKPSSPKPSSPVQAPKPGVKVNKGIPAASRVPPRPERQPVAKENDTPKDARARAQSRYVFIDEEGAKEARPPKEHTAGNRYTPAEKEDTDDQSEDIYQKYRDIDKKAMSRVSRPKPKPIPAGNTGTFAASGLPSFMRGIITAFIIILLLMMIFLIHRTAVLSERLEEANVQLLSIPTLEQELNRARIDLEGAREALAAAEAENTRLTNLAPSDTLTDDLPEEAYGYEEGADYPADNNVDAPAAVDPPAAAPPAAPRIHVVVRGDVLSRIANQFYGSSSPAYIQRIIDANNITDPDSIVVGDRLIIP